jgi:outer membrane lipoprotein carrier protein
MAPQQHRPLIKKPCYAGIAMLVLTLCASPSLAADLIADYFSGLNTFQSNFTQTVTDSNGERVQDAQGRVWMQRPGRFRWDYETPYRQLIVADGERLWTYDEDLEQATVEPVDEALSSTPAMLLSGFKPLDEVMRWVETGSRDGKTWYRLDPKQQDSAVEEVQIAFDAGQLAVIEVRDGFGNHTRIRFSDITRNQSIDPDRFRIQLPPGTDIIGDTP